MRIKLRLTAAAMALIMLIGNIPQTAVAVETSVNNQTTLQNAIDSAASGDTIKLTSNISLSEEIQITGKINLTINLNNHTITGVSGADGTDRDSNADLRNGSRGIGGFIITDSTDIVIQNGTVTGGRGGNGGAGRNSSDSAYNSAGSAGEAGIAVKCTNSRITIDNCKLYGGTGGNGANGGTYSSSYYNSGYASSGKSGGCGIHSTNSRLTVNSSTVKSGAGGNGGNGYPTVGSGGASYGIYISGSIVDIDQSNISSSNGGNTGTDTQKNGQYGKIGYYGSGGISAAIYGTGTVNLHSGNLTGGSSGGIPASAAATYSLNNSSWSKGSNSYGIAATEVNIFDGSVSAGNGFVGHIGYARDSKYDITRINSGEGGDSIAVKAKEVNINGGTITSSNGGTGGAAVVNGYDWSAYATNAADGGASYGVYADSVTMTGGTINAGVGGNGGKGTTGYDSWSTSNGVHLKTASGLPGKGGNSYGIYAAESTVKGGTINAGIGGVGGAGAAFVSYYSNYGTYRESCDGGSGGNSYAVYSSEQTQFTGGTINAGIGGKGGEGATATENFASIVSEETADAGADGLPLLVGGGICTFRGGQFFGKNVSDCILSEDEAVEYIINGNCEFSAYDGCNVADFNLRFCAKTGACELGVYSAATAVMGEYFKFIKIADTVPPVMTYTVTPDTWTKDSVTVTITAEDTDAASSGMHEQPYNFGFGWTDNPNHVFTDFIEELRKYLNWECIEENVLKEGSEEANRFASKQWGEMYDEQEEQEEQTEEMYGMEM